MLKPSSFIVSIPPKAPVKELVKWLGVLY